MADPLAQCYTVLLQTHALPDATQDRIWERWLWGTPVNEPLIDECGDMNVNQGIGVFLCVMLSYTSSRDDRCIAELLPHSPLVHLTKGPLHALTQRQLLDQVKTAFPKPTQHYKILTTT